MNIFIMVLMFLFMAGYYLMDAPSNRQINTEIDYAIVRTDMRSIAECTATAHTSAIRGLEFNDKCISDYGVETSFICLDEKQTIIKCEIIKNKKPNASFIVTRSNPIPNSDYNNMLEILEIYYKDSSGFGVFMDNFILSGGLAGKKNIPESIIKNAKLIDGQLVYITQYEIPELKTDLIAADIQSINCPIGTIKLYRFSRWQCVPQNDKIACVGDKIWDSDLLECVVDNTRRPLCGASQTAVMLDDNWECLDPFLEKNCPGGTVARLNYNTLVWECILDAEKITDTKKCDGTRRAIGMAGTTLRIPSSSCTDCEEMITDPETCAVSCVPNISRLKDTKCYPDAGNCTGPARAFYFGFPNAEYAKNISQISGKEIPIDSGHSGNRKFNCLDCGAGRIDTNLSLPPYIAICE